jgi:hypothetical protein
LLPKSVVLLVESDFLLPKSVVVLVESDFLLLKSVVIRHSRNDKSQILSFENLRGIVRRAKGRKSANSVVTESSSYVTKRTVHQRFFTPKVCLFIFSTMPPNVSRLWAFGGLREHHCRPSDKVNAGAKPAKCTLTSQCA